MKKNKEFDKSLLILLAIILITAMTAFSLYLNVRVDKISQLVKEKGVISILITIVEDKKPLLTQVLLINTETNKGALIDVPENTGTIMSSMKRYSRVDSIYNEQGVDVFRDKIGEILAVDLPYHLVIEKNNFSQLVDLFDGLDIFISKALEDNTTHYSIPSGSVVLEGDKVLQYLDLEISTEHKTGKVSRKQKIMQSFLMQVKKYSKKIVIEKNLVQISEKIRTNLDMNSLKKLFDYLGQLEVDRLVLQGILGESKIVSGDELIFPYNNENLIKVKVKMILINLSNPEVISDEKINFNIEVLNGTNVPGLASRAANHLSSFGYTISGIGNAERGDEEHEFTSILIRKDNREAAEAIGELINCDYIHSQVEEGIDDTIDFTIILGKDFDGKRCN
ncbi:LytR family transcriptional regulator [Thiospirochaeta perfilievii]|uniref:LytR family transcriptional regulator n=1 Tax=Thiospirochaeta perfilievii TaxID=252967 RepID=A0A5C1QGK2_9SPIO|nr:LCP family protein [Thiospirochaeta perfilievii]QEN06209.1 LytR family transcriptional regulator [Thiospirochaeta perfilievii]